MKFQDNERIKEVFDFKVSKKFTDAVEKAQNKTLFLNPNGDKVKIKIEVKEKLPYAVSKNTLMTVNKLISFLQPYPDCKVVSDSGWEGCETDIGAAFINHKHKLIVLTQDRTWGDGLKDDEGWELLFDINEEVHL